MQDKSALLSFVKRYNVLSSTTCDLLMQQSSNYTWRKHSWGDYDRKVDSTSEDTEFERAAIPAIGRLMLNEKIHHSLDLYIREFLATSHSFKYIGFTGPNLNKYCVNTQMLSHVDHIYSCFDGNIKGIPILSIVGLLNDDFVGGEFVFWEDTVYTLNKGDVLIFPSNFLYPHHVNLVTSGTRYSFVSWAY